MPAFKSTMESNEHFIFMKMVAWFGENGIRYDGVYTIKEYIQDASKRGYTWFSTQATSMSQRRADAFNNAISAGQKVTLLLCVGVEAGGTNDIMYKADVLEIITHKQHQPLHTNEYPSLWHGEMAKIWMKIIDIREQKELSAKLFKITSTGADLHTVINGSRYHFGYVNLK